ncbi:MAG: hypothetical protein IKX00_02625 [Bacilli bacterium]|nr:hypothetical protein [Bacilli bacterium]
MEGYFLCLDDLFYYMLNTLKEKNITPDKLTYREMHEYGERLIEYAKTKNIKIYLYLSRELTSKCLYGHQNYIKEDLMYSGYKGLKLIKECSQEELEEEFRTYMPLEVLLLTEENEFAEQIANKYKKEHGMIESKDEYIYYSKNYYVTLADLFFNMLITLKEAGINPNSLTYKECEDYGEIIKEFAKKNNINICLVLSRKDTNDFFNDYYEYVIDNNDNEIKLKKDVDVIELINLCRGYLSLDILMIILNKELEKKVVFKYDSEHNIDNVMPDFNIIPKKCNKKFYTDEYGIIRERKKLD